MLCLNCGTDIGDTIGLCEACQKEQNGEAEPVASDEPTSGDELEAESTEAESTGAEVEEESSTEESAEKSEAENEAEEERAAPLDTPLEEDAKQSETSSKDAASKEAKPQSLNIPLVAAGVAALVVIVAAVLYLNTGDSSAPGEGIVQDEPGESVSEGSEGENPEPSPEEVAFPTAPHLVQGSLLENGRRVAFQDAVFIFSPFSGRIEVGFYRRKLSLSEKEDLISLQSLADAEAAQNPDALFTIFSSPGVTVCTNSDVSTYNARFSAEVLSGEREQFMDFKNQLGGLTEFSCQLKQGASFSVAFSQTKTIERDGKETQYLWELNASGPVYEKKAAETLHFSSADYWSMGMWNKEERILEVGFYRARLNSEQRKAVRESRDLFANQDSWPDFVLSFEIIEGFDEFRADAVRSYGIHFIRARRSDARGFAFPEGDNRVSFYEIMSTEQTDEISALSGALFEAETVSGLLQGAQEKTLDGQAATFSWEVKFSSPVIDVFSEPVSSVVFDPELAKVDRSVPKESSAVIEVGKASAKLVDAIALFYPAEANIVIGLYNVPLSDEDRSTIVRNKGVWQGSTAPSPYLVLTLDLVKGSTSLMRSAIENVRLTFVRDRLGDFYFPGTYDRATVKKIGAELNDATLPHISGNVGADGSLAIRLEGSHVSEKSGLSFTWKLAVRERLVEIN